MTLNDAYEYYEYICKCIVAFLLNNTHQSRFRIFEQDKTKATEELVRRERQLICEEKLHQEKKW